MGLYQQVRAVWKQPRHSLGSVWKERLIAWRSEPSTIRLEYPTRLDRARALGYKAKQGIIVVRRRVLRGGHIRERPTGGRKSKRSGIGLSLSKSYQVIAEERTQRQFENMVVLNSYWVAQDKDYYWYEVILVDPSHPVIRADQHLHWICQRKHWSRVFHGRTSAGMKSRGMRFKGKGFEKARPSRRANE